MHAANTFRKHMYFAAQHNSNRIPHTTIEQYNFAAETEIKYTKMELNIAHSLVGVACAL